MHFNVKATESVAFWYRCVGYCVVLQLSLLSNFGTLDTYSFIQLITTLQEYGLQRGYAVYNLYYPPLSSVMMYPLTVIQHFSLLPMTLQVIAIKAVLALFYYGFIVALLWSLYRYQSYSKLQIAKTACFLLLNLALLESIFILGYFDILLVLPLLLSFFFISREKSFWGGVFIAITFSIKLIPIFLIPAFLVYYSTVTQDSIQIRWKKLLGACLGMALVILPEVWWFGYDNIHYIMLQSSAHGQQLSFAYNLPKIVELVQTSNLTTALEFSISRCAFLLISSLVLLQLWKNPKTLQNLLYTCIGILVTYFMTFTGVHENHLFPALIPAMLLYYYYPNRFHRLIYYSLTILVFLELFIPYGIGYYFSPDGYLSIYTLTSTNIKIALELFVSICTVLLYVLYIWKYLLLPPPSQRISIFSQWHKS